MNKLFLITGPAGVGKSTISKELSKRFPKTILIEGDDIYHLVKNGYVSAWKKGNHLELFWKNSIDLIRNGLELGYDVIFNYIIDKDDLNNLKKTFSEYDITFKVLLTSSEELLKRDKQRPLDCQMKDRCIVLLNNFKNKNYDKKDIIDTTNLSIDEVVGEILK